MKAESTKIIQNLMQFSELDTQFVKNELLRIIRIEQSASKGKFNIWKYVAKGESRPALSGLYHDKGKVVACDACIMAVIPTEYPEEMEGKILLKDGSFLTSEKYGTYQVKYPDYKSVVPSDATEEYKLDFDKFSEIYQDYCAKKKANEPDIISEITINKKATISMEYAKLFIDIMRHIGTDVIWFGPDNGRYRPLYTRNDSGAWGLIMPKIKADNCYEI